MNFISLINVRITKPIGEMSYVMSFATDMIEEFYAKTKNGVLFFTKSPNDIEYAAFAVRQYKDKLSFGRGQENDYKLLKLNIPPPTFPFVVAFSKGKVISIDQPERTAVDFTRWCEYVINPTAIKVKSAEELRLLLDGKAPCFFAVDYETVPKEAPSGVPVRLVSLQLFEYFGISVRKGLYVYRPLDRELVPYDRKQAYEQQIISPLTDSTSIEFQSKDFYGGYAYNETDDDSCEAEVKILRDLSAKYGKTMTFSMLSGETLQKIAKDTNMSTADKPYFIMLSKNRTEGRYLITSPKTVNNAEFVNQFVSRIQSGSEPFSIYSEDAEIEGPEVHFHKTTRNNFKHDIIDNDNDVFVVFTAAWCPHCKSFKPVLREVGEILKETPAKIFWMDGGLNDWPYDFVPEIAGYPTAFLFAKGKKTEPKMFDEKRKFEDVIKFIQENSGNKLEIPEFNATEIEQKINLELHPKKAEKVQEEETPSE